MSFSKRIRCLINRLFKKPIENNILAEGIEFTTESIQSNEQKCRNKLIKDREISNNLKIFVEHIVSEKWVIELLVNTLDDLCKNEKTKDALKSTFIELIDDKTIQSALAKIIKNAFERDDIVESINKLISNTYDDAEINKQKILEIFKKILSSDEFIKSAIDAFKIISCENIMCLITTIK